MENNMLVAKWLELIKESKNRIKSLEAENTESPEKGKFIFGRAIVDAIIDEQNGKGPRLTDSDKAVLKQLCNEINQTYPNGYQFEYVEELRMLPLPKGVSSILLKYIYQFESETCRAYLMQKMFHDEPQIENLDRIIMDLYHHFRASHYYISPPDSPAPAHIYVRYDNTFARLKSPNIMPELVELLKSRRELEILGITAEMIAKKWAPKELGEIMAAHLMNKNVTRADIGLPEEGNYYPSLETIVRQTSFNAISCLRFYPSEENLKILMDYTNHPDKELAKYAQQQVDKMKTKLITEHKDKKS